MRRADREVEKERPAVLGPLVDVRNRLVEHQRLIVDRIDVCNDPVLLDHRADVTRMREAKEVIETDILRPAGHAGPQRHSLLRARLAIYPIHPQVPLSDARGVIAMLFEQRRDRHPRWRNDRRRERREHAELADPKRIASGEHSVASRCANRRSRMGIGETHSLLSELVQPRHVQRRFTAITLRLPPTQVIKQHEHDVRLLRSRKCSRKRSRTQSDACNQQPHPAYFHISLRSSFIADRNEVQPASVANISRMLAVMRPAPRYDDQTTHVVGRSHSPLCSPRSLPLPTVVPGGRNPAFNHDAPSPKASGYDSCDAIIYLRNVLVPL